MNLEKRITNLENTIPVGNAGLEEALTEWLKLHPGYLFLLSQKVIGAIMPEHLKSAFDGILKKTFMKRRLPPNCYNLLKIIDELSEIFKGYATF